MTDIPKSEWGPGPWQDEPDELHWRDARTGLACMILRHDVTGHLCGYVGVPPGHPFHGWRYSDAIPIEPGDNDATVGEIGVLPALIALLGPQDTGTIALGRVLRVHGGITLTGSQQLGDKEWRSLWWFGFDAGHAHDLPPKLVASLRQSGADGAAILQVLLEGSTYRTIDYMKAQCEKLALQLRALETRVIKTPMPEALKVKPKPE